MRTDYDVTLMRQGMANFTVSGGVVQNYLTVRIDNKTRDSLTFRVVSETPGVEIYVPVMEPDHRGGVAAHGDRPVRADSAVGLPRRVESPVKVRVEAVQGHHRPAHVSFERLRTGGLR
jgi:hypothetical protein